MATLLLSACNGQVELNHGLTENDANEVAAELGRYQIAVQKHNDKEGVTLLVNSDDLNRAVHILDSAGLPRPARTNLGAVFQKNGIISTPLEERARYIYALSQEVEETLSQIDGVIVARVHVVLPERVAPGEPVQPASAAVFIKYRADLDPDSMEPRIRRMVSSSIPGMAGRDNKDLQVIFVPAEPYSEKPAQQYFGPFAVSDQQARVLPWLSGFIALLILIGGGGASWSIWQRKKLKATEPPGHG